jgi:hypothetical protein
MMHHPDKVVDTVLIGYNSNVAEHHTRTLAQFLIGQLALDVCRIRYAVDRDNILRRFSTSTDRNIPKGLVGGNYDVRSLHRQHLGKKQKPVEQNLVAELYGKEFWTNIMVIKHQAFTE